jgi:tetratricopeptide (TPR) repeat protein
MAVDNDSTKSEGPSLGDLIGDADPSLKAAISKAKDLKNRGEGSAAKDLLRDLARMYPEEKVVFILLGHLYWGEDDLAHAQACFQKATELDPALEIASLALYHTRWSAGQREEALEEMKRFVQISHSAEYDRILQAFREESARNSL